MQSYLTIDKGKAETLLLKIGLCLWMCRDCKILKSVILLDVPIIVKPRICTLELQEKVMVSNTALAWLGNGDVRPRTNSTMLRDPSVNFATSRANVARHAPHATVFIYCTGSQSTRVVALFCLA